MPAKGTRKIPDKTKVELVIAKQLKPRRTDTNRTLARQFDVAEITVRKTDVDSLTERQKELYNQTIKELGPEARGLTELAIEKSKQLISLANSPKDLAGVVAAGKFGYEVNRLENNQATSITGQAETPEMILSKWIKDYLEKPIYRTLEDGTQIQVIMRLEHALTALEGKDIPGIEGGVKLRFIDGERRKFLAGE